MWLKTENFSNAYGTSTLKSLLPQAFAVSNVHPRPRKHLSRCTLDCGFKTPESPALRGFVAERCPITGTSLYLVLKSNGLRHSKNLPVKFDFSPIDTSATIAKKLPPQRCFKPLLIPIFNFSRKRLTFAFTGESGYTTRLSAKDRTQRLTRRNRGLPSLDHSAALCRQRNTLYSATLLYTYISRFSVNPQHQQKRIIRQRCRHKFYPQPLFNFSYKRPTFAFTSESGHTLGFRRRIAHSGLHAETGGVSDGGGITTLGAFRTFTNIPGPGIRTANFAAFGSWSGMLPKNAEGLRDSDALMRVAVPQASRPRWAAQRCCSCFDLF